MYNLRHNQRNLREYAVAAAVLVAFVLPTAAQGALISDPTTSWTAITYANPNQYDYADDQQTGDGSCDIVGDNSNPAFYTLMDPGDPNVSTDGVLFYRARLGEVGKKGAFGSNLFVGIDGNGDGSLDLYLGVHNQGSSDELAIYGPGSGANVSPNTTTISGPNLTYAETALNYRYQSVDTTATDVDGDGKTDYFLSFGIPFADIVAAMAAQSITIDDMTPLSYVLATATQDNSFNQDINGVPKNYNSNATWSSLGVLSNPLAPNSTATPEPSSLALMGMASLCGFGGAYRRRRAAA